MTAQDRSAASSSDREVNDLMALAYEQGRDDGLGDCRHCIVACGNCPETIRSERRLSEGRMERVREMEAALREIANYPFDVNQSAEQDLGSVKEIARRALNGR